MDTHENMMWYVQNVHHLKSEFNWMTSLIERRVQEAMSDYTQVPDLMLESMQDIDLNGSPYADLVISLRMSPEDHILLMLAVLPYLRPSALDPFLVHHVHDDPMTDFGEARPIPQRFPTHRRDRDGKNYPHSLPTAALQRKLGDL
jgi:hypothetical protein